MAVKKTMSARAEPSRSIANALCVLAVAPLVNIILKRVNFISQGVNIILKAMKIILKIPLNHLETNP
ncbi:MAG: hypothetical protein K9J17_14940 [Flavobacteriales bacterium]|nr:hypothetical protein [Flavobacteriales bacterium]